MQRCQQLRGFLLSFVKYFSTFFVFKTPWWDKTWIQTYGSGTFYTLFAEMINLQL